MVPASTAILPPPAFVICWVPLCGLLLAAGGMFFMGSELTGVASQGVFFTPPSSQERPRGVAMRAITSWEEPRREVWSARVGGHSAGTVADRWHQRAISAPRAMHQAQGTQAEADQLAASLRRAYLRNPLATAAVEQRGDAKTRKCPVCDVTGGPTDARVDRFEAAASDAHDPPTGAEPAIGATFGPGGGAGE